MSTVNMTVGQFVADTFAVQDSNGAAVSSSNYSVAAAFSDPTIANYSNGHVNALKLGTTTVTYTISGVAANGYTGSVTVGPDTINVNPKSLASATVSYSAPQ